MIISVETQQEMYTYLAKQSLKNMYVVDSSLSEIIDYQIRVLAQKLYNRSELFVRKASFIYNEKDEKIETGHELYSLSNALIYNTLENIKGCKRFLINTNKSDIHDIDYSTVIESGSPDRIKLIQLCKKFMQHKELSAKKTSNTKDQFKVKAAEVGTLADQTIGAYTLEIQKEYNQIEEVFVQKHLKSEHKFMQDLVPDIVIVTSDKVYVIDVKVRKTIASVNEYHPFAYTENSNRFQVNSYIGMYKSLYTNKAVEGILLHFADEELYNENEIMQGKEASIESDRPIHLYIIEDRGLDNIFADYRKIIESII